MSNREYTYLDFNPRDDTPHVVGLVVDWPTSVVYGNQCGGLACLWRSLEGYLSVVGGGAASESFASFFRRFEGRPPLTGTSWKEEDLLELSSLIARTIRHLVTDSSGYAEVEIMVRLDLERADDLTEAWIPVVVGDGRGVLLFPNSD
jgi:hypothetical protein